MYRNLTRFRHFSIFRFPIFDFRFSIFLFLFRIFFFIIYFPSPLHCRPRHSYYRSDFPNSFSLFTLPTPFTLLCNGVNPSFYALRHTPSPLLRLSASPHRPRFPFRHSPLHLDRFFLCGPPGSSIARSSILHPHSIAAEVPEFRVIDSLQHLLGPRLDLLPSTFQLTPNS